MIGIQKKKSTYILEDINKLLLRLFPESNKVKIKNENFTHNEEYIEMSFDLMEVRLTGALSRLGI